MSIKVMKQSFWLTMIFFFSLLALFTFKNKLSITTREDKLPKQIEELYQIQQEYDARAKMHQNKADILLQMDGEKRIAKRHKSLAKENQKISNKLKKEISKLQRKNNNYVKAASSA